MKKITYLFIILFAVLTSCNSGKAPKDAKLVDVNTKSEVSGNNFQIAGFSLQLPEGWTEESPSNSMRITQFSLKSNPDYEVVVSYFGEMENMAEANIDRWKEQFAEIDEYRELEIEHDGLTAIKLTGTFKMKPMPMAQDFVETPDYGTLAAIVPSKQGPYFLKLTAPKQIIDEQEEAFIETLNSYQKK